MSAQSGNRKAGCACPPPASFHSLRSEDRRASPYAARRETGVYTGTHTSPSTFNWLVTTGDTLALSFGLISTLLAILTVVVTRINHPARVQREPQYIGSVVAHPQDMMLEEMRLRRWSSIRRGNTED
ncbi:hypothetical protein BGZ57DRAFT_1000679 [Hyaloscypha finlandica]|nr:hypothetical protein BGZ57DRAFT_1000679 [Hyaloscypha finlandica]